MDFYKKGFEKGTNRFFFRKRLHHWKCLELLAPEREDKILEIGCSDGELVKILRNYADEVVGIDINREVIESSGVKGLKVGAAEELEFEAACFDKVVLVHVIEHLPDLRMVFVEIERVLKKGGMCVLIYPWEIFRGSNFLLTACWFYGDPSVAWKQHLHQLNPQKIARLTRMRVIKKGLFWGPYPTYYTVLRK